MMIVMRIHSFYVSGGVEKAIAAEEQFFFLARSSHQLSFSKLLRFYINID